MCIYIYIYIYIYRGPLIIKQVLVLNSFIVRTTTLVLSTIRKSRVDKVAFKRIVEKQF